MWLYSVSAKDLACNFPPLTHNWGVMWQQHAGFSSISTMPAFNTRHWQNWVWQLSSRPGDWLGSRDVVREKTCTPAKRSRDKKTAVAAEKLKQGCGETGLNPRSYFITNSLTAMLRNPEIRRRRGRGRARRPSEGVQHWKVNVWVLTATQTLWTDT